jgi:lipopolysaccharide transport system ATP-binding protein
MTDVAIRVTDVSKTYRIAAAKYGHDTLRDQLADGLKSFLHRRKRDRSANEIFWALRNVSFEVQRGEIVGIIGSNGAGKSTLLKILSRITEPDSGRAEVYGRIASLLEIGTGFDRELTGRENTYLSGAILGMKKAEIDRKFDEIVAFADIERFIDTPVKRYSSGMYVRLAFAVAAHLEPEILLVDEVLAVGDSAFQRKCLGKMGDVANEGRTVLFVSHNMAAITRLCRRGIWLDNGRVSDVASAEDVVAKYLASGVHEPAEISFRETSSRVRGTEFVRLLSLRIRSADGRITSSIDARSALSIEVEYEILRRASLRIGLRLVGQDGTVLFTSDDSECASEDRDPGVYLSECTIPGNFLNYGQYFVTVGADTPLIQTHFHVERVLAFHIERTGGVGGHISDGRQGLLRLALPWSIRSLESEKRPVHGDVTNESTGNSIAPSRLC